VICKRIEGQHYAIPPTAPLPQFRVEESPAFTNTGIDFAGPLFVKRSAKEKGNIEKVYTPNTLVEVVELSPLTLYWT